MGFRRGAQWAAASGSASQARAVVNAGGDFDLDGDFLSDGAQGLGAAAGDEGPTPRARFSTGRSVFEAARIRAARGPQASAGASSPRAATARMRLLATAGRMAMVVGSYRRPPAGPVDKRMRVAYQALSLPEAAGCGVLEAPGPQASRFPGPLGGGRAGTAAPSLPAPALLRPGPGRSQPASRRPKAEGRMRVDGPPAPKTRPAARTERGKSFQGFEIQIQTIVPSLTL